MSDSHVSTELNTYIYIYIYIYIYTCVNIDNYVCNVTVCSQI